MAGRKRKPGLTDSDAVKLFQALAAAVESLHK